MRIEIAGAQITEGLVELIEELQQDQDVLDNYLDTLRDINRSILRDATLPPEEVVARLHTLQCLDELLRAIAFPPGVDDPENDIPTASF